MSLLPASGTSSWPAWAAARDPRLPTLCALMAAVTAVSLSQLSALLLQLALMLVLAAVLGTCWRTLGRRLLALEGLMIMLLLTLPFTVPGDPLWQWHSLTLSLQGLERAAVVALRANIVVIAMVVLLGALAPEQLGHALGRLRLPDKLVHLFLFTARYLVVLQEEYRRLRTAMRARGFVARSNRHSWRSLGWLVGMLLVRSMERSQRVTQAMKCRGFKGRFYLLNPQSWCPAETGLLLSFGGLMSLPLLLEYLL
ncbi:cobalt/nickel transport system permease protein [Ferrimonas sediminum]|uniref:Cobalt/nickel transport system permease protein n=1 Tax=Ferrimonas sediminum TaxID=718193 RepID=A0A1G8T832_9GAMM|nr:cobalt ECF transporter T component CbiQ [Ferrimonas sediminum]SDJ37702.1 cobalt/nickel transport system permease protein [Ferrimonas sediminum]